ncbi:MAG: DUF2171 domain-containing protein [Enterobacter hormaechei]
MLIRISGPNLCATVNFVQQANNRNRRIIMVDKSAIKDHTQVVASCGTHVGVVDHLDGERIKLAKSDPNQAASTTLFLSAGSIRSKIIKLSDQKP